MPFPFVVAGWLMAALNLSPAQSAEPTSRAAQSPAAPPRGFIYRSLQLGKENYAYCAYVPPEYSADQRWPVVLFLHGSGERGVDGFAQTDTGIGPTLRRSHQLIPAIVVMPQCRPQLTWTGDQAAMAIRCVDDVARDYRIDPQRVCLTGISLGGAGCFFIGARASESFAAIVPICGFDDVADAPGLAKTPIWIWHGSADRNVPVKQSRDMADAIKAAGGDVKYTEVPGGDHFIWDKVYGDPELWKWVFAQKRMPATTQPAGG